MVTPSRTSLGAHRLRAINLPQPIAVEADADGTPLAVRRGDRVVQVASIEDTWRIDEEWWRQQIARHYFLLVLEDGRIITVFEDEMSGVWYRQNYS